MSDKKQVEVEIDGVVRVPLKLTVEVDLDRLREGVELDESFEVVAVAPLYKVLEISDAVDAVLEDSIGEIEPLVDAVDEQLQEMGIDVADLQAEAECDCGDECEGCDEGCDEDEDDEDEGDDE